MRAEDWQIRLPLEWEWQWAAQGGTEVREYPWEGGWQEGYANTSEAGLNRTTAVGMYPHGGAACGALDMSGNLWEWCQNDRKEPKIIDCYDNGNRKVLRGGSFIFIHRNAACAYRDRDDPHLVYDNFGLRLVVGAPIKRLLTL